MIDPSLQNYASYNMSTPTRAGKEAVLETLSQAGRISTTPAHALAYAPDAAEKAQETVAASKAKEKFGFADFLDIINPLQHIPVVNIAYRHLTGDEIKAGPQVVGDTIFGGALGGVMSLANVMITEQTGKDIPGNVMAFLGIGDNEPALNETIQVVQNDSAQSDEEKLQTFDANPDVLAAQMNAIEPGAPYLQDLPGTVVALANMKHEPEDKPQPRKSAFVSFALNT